MKDNVDSSNKPKKKNVDTPSSSSKKRSSTTSKSPYFSDPQLLHRVDKYLSRHKNDEIDKDDMVEELRDSYKEYGRKNRSAFRHAVIKAFNIITKDPKSSSSDESDKSSEIDVGETEQASEAPETSLPEEPSQAKENTAVNANADAPPTSENIVLEPSTYMDMLNEMVNISGINRNGRDDFINISSDEDVSLPPSKKHKSNDKGRPKTISIIGPIDKERLMSRVQENLAKSLGYGNISISKVSENTSNSNRRTKNKGPQIPQAPQSGVVAQHKTISSHLKKRKVYAVPSIRFMHFGGNKAILTLVGELILHMKQPEIYIALGITPPRGFLLHGPPGCGKTLLAHAIAGELGVPLVKVAAPELVGGISGESEQRVRDLFQDAKLYSPCVLFIDEIDAICSRRDLAQKDMEKRIVSQLISSLDELNAEEMEEHNVIVIGATNRPDSLDPALRRAGRFDKEVSMGIPDTESREYILEIVCADLKLSYDVCLSLIADLTPGFVGADLKALCNEAALAAVRRNLRMLKKSARAKAIGKPVAVIDLSDEKPDNAKEADKENESGSVEITEGGDTPKTSSQTTDAKNAETANDSQEPKETDTQEKTDKLVENDADKEDSSDKQMEVEDKTGDAQERDRGDDVTFVGTYMKKPSHYESEEIIYLLHCGEIFSAQQLAEMQIEQTDFETALKKVQPSAMREGFATVPDVTWNDIGSLKNIRQELTMCIMMPVKFPKEFEKMGISTPTGILLCGPPGCGKTLLAKAIANEANINFISVKGPELLNMYVGESERAVRQCFQRAKNSQPCVIFFDEIDSLCPKRSDSIEGSASSRVVNQLLTEMDGVEGRQGVFLIAATNRPDMVDPAVLRPGRLDKILYVDLPSASDRVDILKALTKNGTKPPLDKDVDLNVIGASSRLDGYTGADLAALIREASVQALTNYLSQADKGEMVVMPAHFETAVMKIRPSVSTADRLRYEELKLFFGTVPGATMEVDDPN